MKRGRKSASDLAVVKQIDFDRPKVPKKLNALQAAIWDSTVARMPTNWFLDETHQILAAYCRHADTLALISDEIDRFKTEWIRDDGGIERLGKLTQMRQRESNAMIAAARSLRITKSAQTRPETAHRQVRDSTNGGSKPWEG